MNGTCTKIKEYDTHSLTEQRGLSLNFPGIKMYSSEQRLQDYRLKYLLTM